VAIGFYEGPSKEPESVEARYPDILLSDLRSAIFLVLLVNDSECSRSTGAKPILSLISFRFSVDDSEYSQSARQ
jgi:hypothetical protein